MSDRPKRRHRRANGTHGPERRTRSVDLSVYASTVRQRDEFAAEINRLRARDHYLQRTIVGMLRATGGVMRIEPLPDDLVFDVEQYAEGDGAIVLTLTAARPSKGEEPKPS